MIIPIVQEGALRLGEDISDLLKGTKIISGRAWSSTFTFCPSLHLILSKTPQKDSAGTVLTIMGKLRCKVM